MKKMIFIIAFFSSNLWANITDFADEEFKDIPSIMGINTSCANQEKFKISQPNHSDDFILEFSHIAVLSSYTYSFVDPDKDLKLASLFYTLEGWKKFKDHSEHDIAILMKKKLVNSVVATKLPTITTKGIANGRYYWEIQIPILITRQSATEITKKNIVIKLTVTRVNLNENPVGIAITRFAVSEPLDATTYSTTPKSTIQSYEP